MARAILLLISLASATGLAGCATPCFVGGGGVRGFGYSVGYAIGSSARNFFTGPPSMPERVSLPNIRRHYGAMPARPVSISPHRRPVITTKRPAMAPTPVKTPPYFATKKKVDPLPTSGKKAKNASADCPLENVW